MMMMTSEKKKGRLSRRLWYKSTHHAGFGQNRDFGAFRCHTKMIKNPHRLIKSAPKSTLGENVSSGRPDRCGVPRRLIRPVLHVGKTAVILAVITAKITAVLPTYGSFGNIDSSLPLEKDKRGPPRVAFGK